MKLKQVLQNIFSAKNDNDGKHKVFTIFGIKLKFKRILKNKQNNLAKPSEQLNNITSLFSQNKIILIKQDGTKVFVDSIAGFEINFYGTNSTVEIHEPFNFINCRMDVGNNNYIKIGPSPFEICDVLISPKFADGSKLIIGENFSCREVQIYVHDEPNTLIEIGNDVQIAAKAIIWPSDGHCITDANLNIINKGEDIHIGNHVWICTGARILKGSNVPDNSIIGMSSIFVKSSTKSLENIPQGTGYIFGGIPAKPIKSGIM